MAKKLYLIAVLPAEKTREKVRELKLEMKDRFNASHALKAPAHITLQMPFWRDETDEQLLVDQLEKFSANQPSFRIEFDGFDAFSPRVIFIRIQNPEPVINLHSHLVHFLTQTLSFTKKEINEEIHPHMTIATRDLRKKAFGQAWPEFKDRDFQAAEEISSLFLLRHTGKHWKIFRELPFGNEQEK